MRLGGGFLTPPPKNVRLVITKTEREKMTLGGYTYQIGDLFTTSKVGVTGRIEQFIPVRKNVTRVALRLANGQRRLAMVKTY
jgi:hypothetical protein